MNDLLAGGIATAALLCGLFFLRFWRDTGDRFFLLFAIAFWIEGGDRLLISAYVGPDETSAWYYLPRIVAYGLIMTAIIQKNRPAR